MLAPCGLLCDKCEAFIATQNNDEKAFAIIAEKWSKLYNAQVEIDHLYCDGCTANGRKSYYCGNLCEIKKCVDEKQLADCGKCDSFACEKLESIYQHEPEAKQRLVGN
ncbi:DUF3795 domain-containing protein [Methanococcoides sp. SA1]|nr:DUF3795 domain-containing protein [Methanococcoides sp. SA1]